MLRQPPDSASDTPLCRTWSCSSGALSPAHSRRPMTAAARVISIVARVDSAPVPAITVRRPAMTVAAPLDHRHPLGYPESRTRHSTREDDPVECGTAHRPPDFCPNRSRSSSPDGVNVVATGARMPSGQFTCRHVPSLLLINDRKYDAVDHARKDTAHQRSPDRHATSPGSGGRPTRRARR